MFTRTSSIALFAHRSWTQHNSRMSKALERLCSGKRINSAADDPAGLGISERMKMRLTMLGAEKDNVSMGMSMIEASDGIMGEMNNMLNRMLELAGQAASGALDAADREKLNEEYQQLADEIHRLGLGSTFNTQHLFQKQEDAAAPAGTYAALTEEISFTLGSEGMNTYLNALDIYLNDISAAAANGDDEKLLSLGIDRSNGKSDGENLRDAVLDFTREQSLLLSSGPDASAENGPEYVIKVDGEGISVKMPRIDKESLGLKDTNLLTQDGAFEAMDAIKGAIDSLLSHRSSLGATYNRLQHTTSLLSTMEENLSDALSRITDADMAREMMSYVKEQVLAQAAMFAMAQAVKKPEDVIYLLNSL